MLSSLFTLALVPLIAAQVITPPPRTYVNTALARTVELGGASTLVTTQFNVKALADSPGPYHLALVGDGDAVPAWWEVAKSGKPIEGVILADEGAPTVQVPLGVLKEGDVATFSLTYVLAHASEPLPATIAQTDPQYLLWKTNSTYVDSWYPSDVERIKIRAPVPNILSHDQVPTTYTRDSTTTKTGATLTLGPFHSVPPTLGYGDHQVAQQQPFSVHYETKQPVIGIRTLRRSAEVSHWGANLNIQDDIALFNNGPALKGHFSRLAHMQSRFHASTPAQILSELTLRLPTYAHSPYYYDVIGNVSTSHFRSGAGRVKRPSTLEMKPRYPLLGGWNYTFTIGYDQPLGESLKIDKGKYVLAVPFLTALKDVVIDDAEVTIVLPEGVTNVHVHTPFKVDSITHSTHKTYLDSTGHHAVTLKKSRCTEHHDGIVYVTYDYPLRAQLQKPLTVAAAVAGLFVFAMAVRRVDFSISK